MKAEELRLEELVDFSEGWVGLHGRRLVVHAMHAFALLRKDLVEMLGLEQTRRILTRFGYYWGQADAAAMERIFDWDSEEEWLKAGPRLHTLQGVARTEVKKLEMDKKGGKFRMEVVWRNSGEAEEELSAMGKSEYPVCRMLVGYASGYASYVMGRDVYFVEEKCKAKGDRVCSATGMDRASWGKELKGEDKNFESADIQGAIKQLTQELRQKTRELARQREEMGTATPAERAMFVEVHSKAFERVMDVATRVAKFDTSVLITGETGTGKELMARYIHRNSSRGKGPFVAVNCSALPETLLESELFGHKKGSFTGAIEDRVGLLEQAAKGTVFLDEIGDVTSAIQTKLLRVLQEREITRVGESTPRKIDVRILAATNQNLEKAVEEGRFREDLLYRLRVVEITVPALRDRKEDILDLARNFVKQFAQKLKLENLRLDSICLDYLLEYDWPGNVRELENAIERAAVMSRDQVIRPTDLPQRVVQGAGKARGAVGGERTLAEVEMEHIRAVLEMTGGNRTKAAKILGISGATLWRRTKGEGLLRESGDSGGKGR